MMYLLLKLPDPALITPLPLVLLTLAIILQTPPLSILYLNFSLQLLHSCLLLLDLVHLAVKGIVDCLLLSAAEQHSLGW